MSKVLVTGGAGFIGGHLVEAMLKRGDEVVVLDNLATGDLSNLAAVRNQIEFIEGDLRDLDTVKRAVKGVDYITHQGALGSVPRSINDPLSSNANNVDGTLNILWAAKEAGVKRFVMASSSSVYGDTDVSPKHEGLPHNPKSPYAFTKVAGEVYSRLFFQNYGLETICLRYFNIFGERQSPKGAYAAVIPIFADLLMRGQRPKINGDGSISRDFTYVGNAVNANLLAFAAPKAACGKAFNIGAGGSITLNELYENMRVALGVDLQPEYGPERQGDVQSSKASIALAEEFLGYKVLFPFEDGMNRTVSWFKEQFTNAG